jgi:hypothetical protein
MAGRASNNPKAVVPWGAIHNNQDDFIDHEYLPDNAKVLDTSKMKSVDLQACLTLWRERQESGLTTFRLKKVLPNDIRSRNHKRKRETSIDATSGEDSADAETEPPRKINKGKGRQVDHYLEGSSEKMSGRYGH